MDQTRYCENCGQPLAADWQFCESCGSPVTGSPPPAMAGPAASQTRPVMQVPVPQPVPQPAPVPQRAPPTYAYTPPPAPLPRAGKKNNSVWLIVVVVVACLCLACGAVSVVGGYFYFQNGGQPGFPLPEGLPLLPIATPVVTEEEILPVEPTLENLPLAEPTDMSSPQPPVAETIPQNPEPTQAVKTTGPVNSTQETYSRWLLDYSLQWDLGQTDIYMTDITQDHSYLLGMMAADNIVMIIPPSPYAYADSSVYISYKIKPGDLSASGPYGAMCNVQDENNYYVAEIWGQSFGIGKMLDGVFIPLTDPYWQPSQFIDQVGDDGFIEIGVTCFYYSIGLEINGLGEVFPLYDEAESFTGGAVAFFGASSQEPIDMLMGMFTLKDLLVEQIQ